MNIKFNLENIRHDLGGFLKRQLRIIVFAAAIFMSGYTVYVWYYCLYKPEWSQAEIEAYIKKKDKGIIFKKEKFEEAVKIYDGRKKSFEEKTEKLEDIFDLKK